jgi:glycerophosphoryl diester phosphodiesterase
MWVIAHRGASGSAPENTLAAFRRAVDLGADFVETDLQLSRDARLVALHDDRLERTTNGTGSVTSATVSELRLLDAGSWFLAEVPDASVRLDSHAPGGAASTLVATRRTEFAGERIPTVEEVLAFGRERDIGLFLELKPVGPSGAEHALVGALRAADEIRRTVVICFNLSSLVKVRALEPMLVTGYLCDENVADAPARAVDAGARQLLPRADLITTALVVEARRKDLKVVAWTVNEVDRMRELRELGVDGIITNYPERLVAVLRG